MTRIIHTRAPESLDELMDVLNGEPDDDGSPESWDALAVYTAATKLPGSPTSYGIDWTALPTYGGEDADNLTGLVAWSWDATRLLVGERGNLRIIPRGLTVEG